MSEKRNINLTIADIPLNLNISAKDYVSLLHTIKMLQQEQKFNEIEQINLKLDEFIKE